MIRRRLLLAAFALWALACVIHGPRGAHAQSERVRSHHQAPLQFISFGASHREHRQFSVT